MLHKNFFCKNWSRVFCLLLLSVNLFAQTSSYPVNCGQLAVITESKSFTGSNEGSSCYPCCIGTMQCERIEYEVFLVASNIQGGITLPSNGNFSLAYSELYITLRLNRGTNAVVSSIDEAETEFCLASYLSSLPDGSYETKITEDEVTLHISAEAGDPTPTIPFIAFKSSGHLFSIVVNAFPGESLGIECVEFTYVSAEECEDETCSGVSNATFPPPSQGNSSLSISLGDINCQPEEYIELPILVSSTIFGTTISSLDFAVVISNNAPDGFYASPEFTDILSGTSPSVDIMFNDATAQYVVRIKYTTQNPTPFGGTDIQLGILRIYRPPGLCQGYTIAASLLPGRIRVSGLNNPNCRAVQTGASTSAQCSVAAMSVCDDFQFNVTTEDDLEDCSTLKVYATLSWDPGDFGGANSLSFEQVRAILTFDMDNGVSITDAELEGLSCPTSGNDPVTCPGSSCLQFSGNTVELCINVGSPITVANNARIVITFDAPTGCIQSALVRKMALKRPSQSVCQPDVNPPVGFPYCSPILVNYIQGDIATEQACWIQEVYVAYEAEDSGAPSSCDVFMLSGDQGNECEPYSSGCLCDIETVEAYKVTPTKDDNPLNGVTTFDLVLISKHILGLEPLDSPYKMIAADANKSGSISSFDIVEFRKLILGIYTELPNNTSWRFVDKSFSFPNANNPFQTAFPEDRTVSSLPDTEVDFYGVKIGDVNNTVVTDCNNCDAFERPAGIFTLLEPRRDALKSGEYYTLPVRAGSESPLIAWQSAFRFDPEVLELVSPSLGDVPGISAESFNLSQAGEGLVRALWFSQPDAWEEESLSAGKSLFNLTFRVKQDIPETAQLISIDEEAMPNLGYSPNGAAFALQAASSSQRDKFDGQKDQVAQVICHPNPSSGEVFFDINNLPKVQRVQLTVFDAFGHRIWQRDLRNDPKPIHLGISEAATWPNGVYHWELRFDKQKSTGTFIRQ